jgi:hypothetical protein
VRSIPLPVNSSVVSCSFSHDNKFLAVLEDAPAHTVTYWKVSNAKLVASCKCPSRGSRIHISPTNANFISVSGPTTLKYWVWTNNDFKIANFLPQLKDQEHFVDHTWLKEHMIALTERGLLLCFRSTLDGCSADLVHSSRWSASPLTAKASFLVARQAFSASTRRRWVAWMLAPRRLLL